MQRFAILSSSSAVFAALLLLLMAIAATVRLTVAPTEAAMSDMPFLPSWVECVAGVVVMLITGIVVGRTGMTAGLFHSFCTLPIALYGFAATIALSSSLLLSATVALCVAFGTLAFLRNISLNDLDSLLVGSLLYGTAAVAMPCCAILVLLLPVAVAVFPLSWRQTAVVVFGWTLPTAATCYVAWYVNDEWLPANVEYFWRGVFDGEALSRGALDFGAGIPIMSLALVALFFVLAVMAIIMLRTSAHFPHIHVRRAATYVVAMAVVMLVVAVVSPHKVAMLPLLAVPVALLSAVTLNNMRQRVASAIYCIVVLMSIANLFVGRV